MAWLGGASESDSTNFKSQLYHLLALWPWVIILFLLSHNFLISEMEMRMHFSFGLLWDLKDKNLFWSLPLDPAYGRCLRCLVTIHLFWLKCGVAPMSPIVPPQQKTGETWEPSLAEELQWYSLVLYLMFLFFFYLCVIYWSSPESWADLDFYANFQRFSGSLMLVVKCLLKVKK